MNFSWGEYLELAESLARDAARMGDSGAAEARFRSAISRAYYAAHGTARDHLRDREDVAIPTDWTAHRVVIQNFQRSLDPFRQQIARNLRDLRGRRNAADYDDSMDDVRGASGDALAIARRTLDALPSPRLPS